MSSAKDKLAQAEESALDQQGQLREKLVPKKRKRCHDPSEDGHKPAQCRDHDPISRDVVGEEGAATRRRTIRYSLNLLLADPESNQPCDKDASAQLLGLWEHVQEVGVEKNPSSEDMFNVSPQLTGVTGPRIILSKYANAFPAVEAINKVMGRLHELVGELSQSGCEICEQERREHHEPRPAARHVEVDENYEEDGEE